MKLPRQTQCPESCSSYTPRPCMRHQPPQLTACCMRGHDLCALQTPCGSLAVQLTRLLHVLSMRSSLHPGLVEPATCTSRGLLLPCSLGVHSHPIILCGRLLLFMSAALLWLSCLLAPCPTPAALLQGTPSAVSMHSSSDTTSWHVGAGMAPEPSPSIWTCLLQHSASARNSHIFPAMPNVRDCRLPSSCPVQSESFSPRFLSLTSCVSDLTVLNP